MSETTVLPRYRLGRHPLAWNHDWRTLVSARNRVRMDADRPIPLRDGTILRADVYRPAGGAPAPVILSWSAYNKELHTSGLPQATNEIGLPYHLASHGYAHVVLSRRGTAPSEGEIDLWFSPREQDDLDQTITWCGTQPWSNGSVVMHGASYYGLMQLHAATKRNPHLRAIMPVDPDTSAFRHQFYHGGVFNYAFFALWCSFNFTDLAMRRRVNPRVRHLLSYLFTTSAFRGLMSCIVSDERIARFVARQTWNADILRHYVSLAFDQKLESDFYGQLSSEQALSDVTIPMLIGTNWSFVSIHGFGAMDAFFKAGSADKKVFIAPAHDWLMGRPWTDYQDEAIGFFDHQVKGIDNGYGLLPRVRYWLQGANEWRGADGWPPPEARLLRLELAGVDRDNTREQALAARASPGENSWLAVPKGSHRPNGLSRVGETENLRYVFTFDRDTSVVGPVRITLQLRCTAMDTYVVARILDVAPDGSSVPLSHGFQLASFRRIDERRTTPNEVVHDFSRQEPLPPGEVVRLVFSPTPIANRFRAAHKLVLELASRKDLQAPEHGSKAERERLLVYFDAEAPPYSCRNTVVHGGSDPSRIEIYSF